MNLHVNLEQGPYSSPPYCFDFIICIAKVRTSVLPLSKHQVQRFQSPGLSLKLRKYWQNIFTFFISSISVHKINITLLSKSQQVQNGQDVI